MWSVSANRVGYMYDSIFHPDNSLLRSSDVVSPAIFLALVGKLQAANQSGAIASSPQCIRLSYTSDRCCGGPRSIGRGCMMPQPRRCRCEDRQTH
eukprot:s4899_g2.t1